MRRAVLLVNPISGSARRARAVERYAEELGAHGVAIEIRPTRGPGDGAVLAREAAAEGVDVLVAAGGDGTVNEVARGLLEVPGSPSVLAVLPLGTSNLVARHLGIPLHPPHRAAAGVADGEVVRVDVARAGGRPFLACAGVGFDAHVVATLSAQRRGHIGFSSYAAPTLRAVREYRAAPLRVTDDGGAVHDAHHVLVLNMRPYAAFLTPVPDASATDGLLDVVLLRGDGVVRLARWTLRAALGRLVADRDAVHLRTSRLRVESAGTAPVQIDGDVGGATPVDMLVVPRALAILRPRTAARSAPCPTRRTS